MKFNEIFKLKEMLEKAEIPFEFKKVKSYCVSDTEPGYQILYPNSKNRVCSVLQSLYTDCSNKTETLEIMGLLTPAERRKDNLCSNLTADNVFNRIYEHYYNKDIYRALTVDGRDLIEGVKLNSNTFLVFDKSGNISYSQYFGVIPETISQRTGVYDKNGKPIWDKCECMLYKKSFTSAKGFIKYIQGCFCFVEYYTHSVVRLCDLKLNNLEIEVVNDYCDFEESKRRACV